MNRILLAAIAALVATPALAASPFDGTWKFDLKSQEVSKKPSVQLLNAGSYTCSTCVPAYTVKADGAFHKVAGNPYLDEVSVKVVDATSIKWASRKGGKPMSEFTKVVSADGMTATSTFNDMTAENGVAVTGTTVTKRVAAGPKGAHAVSGSWVDTTQNNVAEAGLLMTIKLDGKAMTFKTPTGISFTTMVDGPPSPVKGDPGWTTVSLKAPTPKTLVETDYREGKPIGIYTYTIAADGKTMRFDEDNLLRKSKTSTTLVKQ